MAFLSSCQGSKEISESIPNPCSDSLYKVLSLKNISNMSDKEYSYYLTYKKDCENYSVNKKIEESKSNTAFIVIMAGVFIAGITILVVRK